MDHTEKTGKTQKLPRMFKTAIRDGSQQLWLEQKVPETTRMDGHMANRLGEVGIYFLRSRYGGHILLVLIVEQIGLGRWLHVHIHRLFWPCGAVHFQQ